MAAQVSRPVLHKLITTSPRQSRLISSPLARTAPLTSQDSSPVQGSFRPNDITIPTHAQPIPAAPSLLAKTRRRTDSILSPTVNPLDVGSSRRPIPTADTAHPSGMIQSPILKALSEAEEPWSIDIQRKAMEDAVRKTRHLRVDPQRIHPEEEQAHSWGSVGEVHRCRLTGKTARELRRVALKKIKLRPKDAPSNRKLLRHILREVIPWHDLDHPNITPFVGYTFDGQSAGILSEFQEGGNLREYMKANPGKGLPLAPQISSGLDYLHTSISPIVHGDVKPENVVLSAGGVPKLVDFGLSTIWDDILSEGLRTSDGCRHTLLYADPVLLDDIPRTTYTDLWALGWIIYELATSRRPYHHRKSRNAILKAIITYDLPTGDKDVPEPIWPILNACWAQNFSDRWSARKITSKLHEAL